MKKSSDQFPSCDGCGREIRGEAKSVNNKNGQVHNFHPDAHSCAAAPEKRAARKNSNEGKYHTPSYSTVEATGLGYDGGKGN
jgi:ribosome-binding protein aMBF1 (putative translation factor)